VSQDEQLSYERANRGLETKDSSDKETKEAPLDVVSKECEGNEATAEEKSPKHSPHAHRVEKNKTYKNQNIDKMQRTEEKNAIQKSPKALSTGSSPLRLSEEKIGGVENKSNDPEKRDTQEKSRRDGGESSYEKNKEERPHSLKTRDESPLNVESVPSLRHHLYTRSVPLLSRINDDSSNSSESENSSTSSSFDVTPRLSTTPATQNTALTMPVITSDSPLDIPLGTSPTKCSPPRLSHNFSTSRERQSTISRPESFPVLITPMSFIPGSRVIKYVGRLQMHFVKETFELRGSKGMSSFTHKFLMEVNGIARAHVISLGTLFKNGLVLCLHDGH
jgi:hypothetical protein